MRKSRTFLILALAIVCGLLAAWTVMRLLEERATAPMLAMAPPPATQVVVAARDLPTGHLLGEDDVKLVNWPGDAAPAGYAQTIGEVVGRGVVAPVMTNEPLLEARLADRSGGGGLPIVIPEGMRATSVRVDDVIGVAGFVTVGTRVDVLLTVDEPSGVGSITKVVLQNVQVLATGQQASRDPQGNPVSATVLTVLVTPEDAEKLVQAAARGRIQLALRNLVDVRDIRTDGARLPQLLVGEGAPRRTGATTTRTTPPATQSGTAVEVIKGGARALIRF